MNFLLPAAFAAFAALLLPILIHLSRRSQTQRTEFAALRWIGAKLRPRRRPVLQERLLLLLRLLLLVVVVLWLAAPVWQRSAPPRDWLLVTPGLDWRGVSDLPAGDTVQRRWLAPGFPPLSTALPVSSHAVPTASLLREWDADAPAGDRLTALVPESLGGLDGQRLRLGREVTWRVLPGSSATRRTPDAPLPALTLLDGSANAEAAIYFRAAYLSWQAGLPEAKRHALPQSGIAALAPDAIAMHLLPGPLPAELRAWLERGGTVMASSQAKLPTAEWQTVWRDEDGIPLLRSATVGQGRMLQWQRRLDPHTMPLLLEPEFADGLQRALMRQPAEPDRMRAVDHTPLRGAVSAQSAPESLRPWFALLAVLLFALERLLAARRGSWSAS